MALTVEDAISAAGKKKYDLLIKKLTDAQDMLTPGQIKEVMILDPKEHCSDGKNIGKCRQPVQLEDDALYMGLAASKEDHMTDISSLAQSRGRFVAFSSREQLYEAAWQMTDLLKDSEKVWYEKIIETNLKFNDITLKQPDIITMIKYFNKLMNNPVIVYDEFFNIVAITDDTLSDYDRDENDLNRYEMQNLFYYKQGVTFLNPNAPKTHGNRLLFPVLYAGMPKGYLAIFDLETPYEKMDMMILEIFANSALTEMRRSLELEGVEKKFIRDFVYDLIYRKEKNKEEIAGRAKRLNVKINARYCMIAVKHMGQMTDYHFDTNGYITQHEFMTDRITNNIENFHTKRYEQDIVTEMNRVTYIIHKIDQIKPGETYENIKEYCTKLLNMLNELFDGMVFQIAIGDIVQTLNDIALSFHQAQATLSYGEILNDESQSFIVCYNDNSLLKLFGRLNEIGCLDEIIPGNLRQISDYDQKHNTQFYETLRTYLNCNCNAKRAAEKLFVHYKTMLYRIEKLKNTFNIDLEDSGGRLFLELGIQLMDMKNKK